MRRILTQIGGRDILFDMQTLIDISVPEPMKAWLDSEAQRGQFGTVGEYVRHLVRAEQVRQHQDFDAEIDQALLASFDGGDSIEVTPEFWAERQRALEESRNGYQKPRA